MGKSTISMAKITIFKWENHVTFVQGCFESSPRGLCHMAAGIFSPRQRRLISSTLRFSCAAEVPRRMVLEWSGFENCSFFVEKCWLMIRGSGALIVSKKVMLLMLLWKLVIIIITALHYHIPSNLHNTGNKQIIHDVNPENQAEI